MFGLSRNGASGFFRWIVETPIKDTWTSFGADWSFVRCGSSEGIEAGLIAYSKGNVVMFELGAVASGC
jgi:hypothetical protein